MTDLTYNGFENKPSWLVPLHIDNIYGLREEVQEFLGGLDMPAHNRQDQLRDYVEDNLLEEVRNGSMTADLLGWAFAHVNWAEVLDAIEED